jgi:hypothetical protein
MAGTALAREIPHQDTRIEFEEKVGGMLERHSDWKAALSA